MDEKTRERIFEAFFSTKQGGSGLGLPTTRKIIEAHGGRILVQSEPGKGTQFTIELPVPARLTAEPAKKHAKAKESRHEPAAIFGVTMPAVFAVE